MPQRTAGQLEVAIIGGGPAGSVAAILLARQGHRITLIDRRAEGTGKACGHCLHPRSGPLLAALGLRDLVNRAARGRTTRVSIHAPGAPAVDLPLANSGQAPSEPGGGWLVDRRSLDRALLDEARALGAEILRPARAVVLRANDPHSHSLRLRITGRNHDEQRTPNLIIGADGVDSRVAHAAGLAGRMRRGSAYGCSFEFRATARDVPHPVGTIAMYLIRGGYLGLARLDDTTIHAGALIDPRRDRAARDPARFVEAVLQHHPALEPLRASIANPADREHFHAMSPMPCAPARRADAFCALVGDAAGFIEPFTGEGMLWAIESAALLAATIREQRGWSGAAAGQYERAWQRRIGRSHRRCALLGRALRHPTLIAGACRLAVGRASLVARLARPFLSPAALQEIPA